MLDLTVPLDRKVATEFLIWNQNRTTGEGLAFLREELGLTHSELGGKLGVSPEQICVWEEARFEPMDLDADKALRSLFA